jgi:phage anti-repressor protein
MNFEKRNVNEKSANSIAQLLDTNAQSRKWYNLMKNVTSEQW